MGKTRSKAKAAPQQDTPAPAPASNQEESNDFGHSAPEPWPPPPPPPPPQESAPVQTPPTTVLAEGKIIARSSGFSQLELEPLPLYTTFEICPNHRVNLSQIVHFRLDRGDAVIMRGADGGEYIARGDAALRIRKALGV